MGQSPAAGCVSVRVTIPVSVPHLAEGLFARLPTFCARLWQSGPPLVKSWSASSAPAGPSRFYPFVHYLRPTDHGQGPPDGPPSGSLPRGPHVLPRFESPDPKKEDFLRR